MQQKILSFLAGIVIGVGLCFSYGYFFNDNSKITKPQQRVGGNMEMTDERLTQMAERMGISKNELQKELDAGKDLRTLMQEKGVNMGGGQRTGSDFTRGEQQ